MPEEEIERSTKTNALSDELEDLLRQARREAGYRLENFRTRNRLASAIDSPRAKVDFAVLCLVLATSVPLVWMPILLQRSASPGLFLGIGVATSMVLVFFCHLVFEGTLAFGEMVKTTIDQSRFLVLKMPRQAEPHSRSAGSAAAPRA